MPPRLGQLYPTTFTGTPPHMAGRDLGIWAIWRKQLPFPYQGFYFDVALGTPPPDDPTLHPGTNIAWAFLLASRIDALGLLPDAWHIIELRRGADKAAVGTVKGYAFLWRRDPPDSKPVSTILVTDIMDPETRAFAESEGITVYELARPEKTPTPT